MNYEDYNRLVVSDVRGALHAAGLNTDEYSCFVERDAVNRGCSSIVIRREFQKIGNRWPIKFGLDQDARQRRANYVANEAVWELWNDNDRHRFTRRAAERMATTDARGALPQEVLDGLDLPLTYRGGMSEEPGRITFNAPGQSGTVMMPVEVKDGRIVASPCCDAAQKALDDIAKLCGCERWEYPGQVVRDVEEQCQEIERLRDEAKRWRVVAMDAQKKHLDILNKLANNETGPSAVAQAPGYERGPRVYVQSQYDLDEE